MLRLAKHVRNAQADQLGERADDGYVCLYTGEQPPTPESPARGAKLAETRLAADAFPPAVDGAITANPIAADLRARATGVAGWFRVLESDGRTPLFDGSITLVGGGGDAQLERLEIQEGADVAIDSLVYVQPM